MTKNKSKPNSVRVGSFYQVPVEGPFLVIVLVAAANKKGAAFGYFYRFDCSLKLGQSLLDSILPSDAFILHQFGDVGIRTGEWALIGKLANFDEFVWIFPPCVQKDESASIAFIHYYDRSTFRCVKLRRVNINDPAIGSLPEDSLWGHKFAELELGSMLGERHKPTKAR